MKSILVRLPADLHAQLQEIAEQEQRSLNAQVVYLLKQAAAGRKARS